ncbi:MAG: tRNA (adenosine(37)-N6)-threonylcarbamoyltransferase complex dimerization subunit type 1 TsaB, partial [Phycisphaerales bacterium]|nr:tRNA (adenosine(37)-N6)-threonylcarbamoyltransferase complex dimerization subunit type 1 TsaB [Phycisphaerales bacterium]
MSVVLGIECSQRLGGVALQAGEGQVSQERLESASGVDDQLMLAIDRLFREAGQAPSTLELIGLSIGPGGFTGLRVAVSTARMLAMTTGCRIVP